MAFRYPVTLNLEGRRCVVVGGGRVAEGRVGGLLDADASVAVVSPEVTAGIERLAADGSVELLRRPYRQGDLAGAFLIVAATGDAAVHAEVFAEAEQRGVLLNSVDDVGHCHFAVPGIVRRGDFLATVSTGGRAPALSKRLRRAMAEDYGPEFGTLVEVLGEARDEALASRSADFATWARRWETVLDDDLLGLVRSGRTEEARTLVRDGLGGQDPPSRPPAGRVSIVGAGPGDPGLLTIRGRERLDSADVVVYDRLVHPSLVAGRPGIFVGKEAGRHPVPQEEINSLLVDLARRGNRVVRLKGGDPFVFGRGSEEAEALARAGVEFEVVPAPTSAVAALASAGIPVTDRRFSSSVAFVTGHCDGGAKVDWRALATAVDTIVILMGVSRLGEIMAALVDGGLDPHTPAALVERGTTPNQRVVTADVSGLPAACARAEVAAPAVAVVGQVVRLRSRLASAGSKGVAASCQA